MLIHTQQFKTKKDAMQYCTGLLNAGPLNEPLDSFVRAFLMELLYRHPSATEKIDCGVRGFFIRQTEYGNRCFMVLRVDGSSIDFSIPACIDGKAKSGALKFRRASRTAIRDQIVAYRDSCLEGDLIRCAASGVLLPVDEIHVDHVAPRYFETLVTAFIATNSIDVEAVEYNTNGTQCTFLDKALASRWSEYHRQQCKLRCVSKHINLARKF